MTVDHMDLGRSSARIDGISVIGRAGLNLVDQARRKEVANDRIGVPFWPRCTHRWHCLEFLPCAAP